MYVAIAYEKKKLISEVLNWLDRNFIFPPGRVQEGPVFENTPEGACLEHGGETTDLSYSMCKFRSKRFSMTKCFRLRGLRKKLKPSIEKETLIYRSATNILETSF